MCRIRCPRQVTCVAYSLCRLPIPKSGWLQCLRCVGFGVLVRRHLRGVFTVPFADSEKRLVGGLRCVGFDVLARLHLRGVFTVPLPIPKGGWSGCLRCVGFGVLVRLHLRGVFTQLAKCIQ